jgi:hypothetical protein
MIWSQALRFSLRALACPGLWQGRLCALCGEIDKNSGLVLEFFKKFMGVAGAIMVEP